MLDKLYEKTLQVESLSQNSFGKLYTITELEMLSTNVNEIWTLQLLKKVASEDLKREAQGINPEPTAHSLL